MKRVTYTQLILLQNREFQSTPSVKRVTIYRFRVIQKFQFQSTPSVKRVTTGPEERYYLEQISIHTLCEEGDANYSDCLILVDISIHTLCEEGDSGKRWISLKKVNFNPHPL